MKLGFSTMWIERRQGKESFGATPKPENVAIPTYHANSMSDFVHQVCEQDASPSNKRMQSDPAKLGR
jgi:hypothetical protein